MREISTESRGGGGWEREQKARSREVAAGSENRNQGAGRWWQRAGTESKEQRVGGNEREQRARNWEVVAGSGNRKQGAGRWWQGVGTESRGHEGGQLKSVA